MRRVTWFVAGAATGVGAARVAKRKARQVADRMTPDHIARQAVSSVKDTVGHVTGAVRDGRAAMRAKEAELRARRDGHPMAVGFEPYDPVIDTDVADGRRATVRHLDDWRRRRS